MEQLTPIQARQVWQRVRGDTEENPLSRLLALEAEIRHTYRWLQTHTMLRDSGLLIRLREDSCRFYGILAGMGSVLELELTVEAPPSVRGNPEGLLRRCFRSRMEAVALLSSLPPALKPNATRLESQMIAHSLNQLELLGKLPK